MAKLKVLQWATGYTGIYALKYILLNPALQLVGLRCFSESKVGRDAGEICGLPPTGIKATLSTDALLGLDADCVVYTPGIYDMQNPSVPGSNTHDMLKNLLRLLASGKNVVSTVCPFIDTAHYKGGDEVRAQIEEACRNGHTTFFATGFEPGFMGDVIPLTLASTCGVVTRFVATEVLDYSAYTAFDTLKQMGFGCKPEELSAHGVEGIRLTWGSVPHIAARGLGVELDEVKVETDLFLSPERFDMAGGVIEKGTVAAMLFKVIGIVGGQPKIVLQHVNRLRDDLAPAWPRIEPGGGYRCEIEGSNPIVATFQMGLPGGEGTSFVEAMAMTAARCVNSVETAVRASPGFKTFLDLPPLTGKYTMRGA